VGSVNTPPGLDFRPPERRSSRASLTPRAAPVGAFRSRSGEGPEESAAASPAHPDAGPVGQEGDGGSADEGLDLPDAVEVEDGGTMDAAEPVAGEAPEERAEGAPDEVGLPAGVNADVVPGGLDAIDVAHGDEAVAFPGGYRHAGRRAAWTSRARAVRLRPGRGPLADRAPWRGRLTFVRPGQAKERLEGGGIEGGRAGGAAASAPNGGPKALVLERLQDVVDGVDVERAEGVFVVRGDEYDGRPALGRDPVEDLETVQPRHLDIQEDQVGVQVLDASDGVVPVGALRYHGDGPVVGEGGAHGAPGQRLIVDEDDA
jgi:hypothetical protein